MSAVSEEIVREYFEMHGFLVQQPRKYAVAARAKRADEEIDLLVLNSQVKNGKPPATMIWGARELAKIPRAIVSVRGWHTDRFSPAVLKISPEVFRFAQPPVLRKAAQTLGDGPIATILCLPQLPVGKASRDKTLALLKEKGIDGVLLFRTMLSELAAFVESNRSYEKSDLLQLLRILKVYDLLKGPQMELFRRKKARKKGA